MMFRSQLSMARKADPWQQYPCLEGGERSGDPSLGPESQRAAVGENW